LTCSRMAASASATKEPRSRPRTLALTTTRRLPSSRLIWFGPCAEVKLATSPSGMKFTRPLPCFGSAIGRRCSASGFERNVSGRRTRMPKRRAPSNNSPASLPPSAVEIVSCTSAMFRPLRTVLSRSMLTVSIGRPVVCSTLASAAPSVRKSTCRIWAARRSSWSASSPNTLTATSARTPGISSLKRIWIGCALLLTASSCH